MILQNELGQHRNAAFSGRQVKITLVGHENIEESKRENWFDVAISYFSIR